MSADTPSVKELEKELKYLESVQLKLSIIDHITTKLSDIAYIRMLHDAHVQAIKPLNQVSEELIASGREYLSALGLDVTDDLIFLFIEAAISKHLRHGDPYLTDFHEDPTADVSDDEIIPEDPDSEDDE